MRTAWQPSKPREEILQLVLAPYLCLWRIQHENLVVEAAWKLSLPEEKSSCVPTWSEEQGADRRVIGKREGEKGERSNGGRSNQEVSSFVEHSSQPCLFCLLVLVVGEERWQQPCSRLIRRGRGRGKGQRNSPSGRIV